MRTLQLPSIEVAMFRGVGRGGLLGKG